MRIKWDCPPTNKELINDFIISYLDNNENNEIRKRLRNSDIISNVNYMIHKYEKKGCIVFNGRELKERDINRLHILNKNLYRNMRIQYIEKFMDEIVAV